LRSAIEHRLDTALDRRKPMAVFELAEVRHQLDAFAEPDHLFIVLGSPVTEVGRDHDYDWAVVEPSSMRSLIQLAGRVRRHRLSAVDVPNLLVFERNLRSIEQPGRAAFQRPGFEGEFRLETHSLQALMSEQEASCIDARPRILPRDDRELQPRKRLADLEHVRLARQMLPQNVPLGELARARKRSPAPALNAALQWTQPQVWLTGMLAQQQPFRDDGLPEQDFVLLPDEDETTLVMHRIADGEKRWETLYVEDDSRRELIDDAALCGPGVAPWGRDDAMQLLQQQAEAWNLPLTECAKRFLRVSLPKSDQGWRYHEVLGFTRRG
jgi:CRISPR-associated endonuclease/helicase Cas3